jgi:hypothetical protein
MSLENDAGHGTRHSTSVAVTIQATMTRAAGPWTRHPLTGIRQLGGTNETSAAGVFGIDAESPGHERRSPNAGESSFADLA